MKKFWKKLSWWSALSNFIVILVLIGILSGVMTSDFYPIAIIFLIPGGISTLMFIIKSIT